jgi:hypothetical protein
MCRWERRRTAYLDAPLLASLANLVLAIADEDFFVGATACEYAASDSLALSCISAQRPHRGGSSMYGSS